MKLFSSCLYLDQLPELLSPCSHKRRTSAREEMEARRTEWDHKT